MGDNTMTDRKERCPCCGCILPRFEDNPAPCCPYCDAILDTSAYIPKAPFSPSIGYVSASVNAPPAFEIRGTTLVKYIGGERFVAVPNGIRTIGGSAFLGCDRIRHIQIPNDVLEIGDCAFQRCTALKTITLSFRLKSIGEYAFRDCSSLASLHIPINVETIGKGAFLGCDSLNEINCDREGLLPSDAFGDSALDGCFTYSTFNELQPCSCGCGEMLPVGRYQRLAARVPVSQSRARRLSLSGSAEASFVKIKLEK